MSPPSKSLTQQAHEWLTQHLQTGDVVIDATAGNGHDTLFLAQRVGPTGQVFGFDIQPAAISATQKRLNSAGLADRVELFQTSHAEMAAHIAPDFYGKVTACMFNLGYLPGSDKSVRTHADSTLAAIKQLESLMSDGAVVSLLIYRGHEGGMKEYTQVLQHLGLGELIETWDSNTNRQPPPVFIALRLESTRWVHEQV